MPGSNKGLYVLQQTCNQKQEVCLSTYYLLLPPGIKELIVSGFIFCSFFSRGQFTAIVKLVYVRNIVWIL